MLVSAMVAQQAVAPMHLQALLQRQPGYRSRRHRCAAGMAGAGAAPAGAPGPKWFTFGVAVGQVAGGFGGAAAPAGAAGGFGQAAAGGFGQPAAAGFGQLGAFGQRAAGGFGAAQPVKFGAGAAAQPQAGQQPAGAAHCYGASRSVATNGCCAC